ncbi:hypothetical protein ACVWWG_000035 [Bradyrhizobium sp. LB7.2]
MTASPPARRRLGLHDGGVRIEALDRAQAGPRRGGGLQSQRGPPATGEFGDAKVIRKFGEVPDDLSAL